MALMPLPFVGHGPPMNIIEDNDFTAGWREIAAEIMQPKAILCISGHMYMGGNAVTGAEHPRIMYDFCGFPSELYEMEYAVPGSPELADRIARLLPETKIDMKREYDHGAWSVL